MWIRQDVVRWHKADEIEISILYRELNKLNELKQMKREYVQKKKVYAFIQDCCLFGRRRFR